MDNLQGKVEAEFEHIDLVINELPQHDRLSSLSILELAGVSTLIHNFSNGIENILKQLLKSRGICLPTGGSWHKELLNMSAKEQVISPALKNTLGEYLAFRHFFIHAYALDLYPDRMEPLVSQCENVYLMLMFKDEINVCLFQYNQYNDNKKRL
ncbi:MAG: hypothetical protein ACL93V_14820 [Candidatus Electrothrix sp. YB6]